MGYCLLTSMMPYYLNTVELSIVPTGIYSNDYVKFKKKQNLTDILRKQLRVLEKNNSHPQNSRPPFGENIKYALSSMVTYFNELYIVTRGKLIIFMIKSYDNYCLKKFFGHFENIL